MMDESGATRVRRESRQSGPHLVRRPTDPGTSGPTDPGIENGPSAPESSPQIPRLDPGEVVRLRDGRAPVRLLWPTTPEIEQPFVGVVEDVQGFRYPFFVDATDVPRYLGDEYAVVEATTVSTEPPSHAAGDRNVRERRSVGACADPNGSLDQS